MSGKEVDLELRAAELLEAVARSILSDWTGETNILKDTKHSPEYLRRISSNRESQPNWLLAYVTYKTNLKVSQKTEELILTGQKSSEMLADLAGLLDKYVKETHKQSKKMTLMTIANFCLVAATTASIILRVLHII